MTTNLMTKTKFTAARCRISHTQTAYSYPPQRTLIMCKIPALNSNMLAS